MAELIDDRFMAVRIRLKRIGAKNTPVFRIVVADSRSPRDGKFIEEIGTYQPLKAGENFAINLERATYWVSKGAQREGRKEIKGSTDYTDYTDEIRFCVICG